MAAIRDEAGRASSYVASDKPLFTARSLPIKYFTKAVKPEGGAESQPASRIPRKTSLQESTPSPSGTITIKGAYGRVVMEEEASMQGLNNVKVAEMGSPSPAPRLRDRLIQRERENARMSRLSESPSGRDGALLPNLAAEDDITSGSGSGSSVSASLRGFEDIADDEIDIKIKNHARGQERVDADQERVDADQERVDALLKSQKVLFSRGHVGSRVTETAHTLVRKTSGSSLENERSTGIRKTWGSKAKNIGSNWLSKNMFHTDSAEEIDELHPPAVSEPFADWTGAVADARIVSVEDSQSIQEPTPPHSRPSSAQPSITSSHKPQTWDADLDFTARSLQISTSPQLKIRSGKLDDIRAREIESLNKRAVATSRLEEIKERVSQDLSESPEAPRMITKNGPIESALAAELREEKAGLDQSPETHESRLASVKDDVTEPSNSSHDQAFVPTDAKVVAREASKMTPLDNSCGTGIFRVVTKIGGTDMSLQHNSKPPSKSETTTKSSGDETAEPPARVFSEPKEHVQGKTIFEEEGEHIHDTPITIFKGTARGNLRETPQDHKLEDSWEVLHKLSKIASSSSDPPDMEVAIDELARKNSGLQVNVKRISVTSTPPKSEIDPEERIAAEASLFELPDNKSERNSLRAPSPIDETGKSNTPLPKLDPLSLLTPIVTGAYIDTPAPTGRRPRINSEDSPPSDWSDAADDTESRSTARGSSRPIINHTHPRTRAQANRSSIDKAIATSTSKATKVLKVKPRSVSRTLVNTSKRSSARDDLRKIQRESQIEDSTLDNFDQFLTAGYKEGDRNSTTTIESPVGLRKDVDGVPLSRKERERLQEVQAYERMNKTLKIASLNIRDAKRGIERLEDRVSCTPDPISQQKLPHTFEHISCATCASSSMVYHLTIPIPRLWWRDSTKLLGIRFTWLGFISFLLLSWVIGESITCEYICHPKYASQSNWSIHDPFWGWALPTLIDRWTAGLFSSAWRVLSRLLIWIYGIWASPSVDSAGGPRSGSAYKVSSGGVEWDAGRAWSEGYLFEDEAI